MMSLKAVGSSVMRGEVGHGTGGRSRTDVRVLWHGRQVAERGLVAQSASALWGTVGDAARERTGANAGDDAAWDTTGVDLGDDAAREITGVDPVDFGEAVAVWLGLKVSDGLDGGNPGARSQVEAVAVDACGIETHAHGTLVKTGDDSEVMLELGEW